VWHVRCDSVAQDPALAGKTREHGMQLVRARQVAAYLLFLVILGVAAGASAQGEDTPGEPAQIQPEAGGDPAERPALTLKIEGIESPASMDVALKIVLFMTVVSLAPALLILLTSFTRIVIVLGFLRQAIGANQAPSNQIIIGLALFLTCVIMAPVFHQLNNEAIQPFLNNELTQGEALAKAKLPLKEFMLTQVREKDVALFLDLTGAETPNEPSDLSMLVVIPSFVISELKTAFQMGFILFIPFLIIDMVVASVLMSMGMMMLPPILISLPFKILLFVLVDGWFLVVRSLVTAFQ
jgi:flagellar biosynthetic protein FliP